MNNENTRFGILQNIHLIARVNSKQIYHHRQIKFYSFASKSRLPLKSQSNDKLHRSYDFSVKTTLCYVKSLYKAYTQIITSRTNCDACSVDDAILNARTIWFDSFGDSIRAMTRTHAPFTVIIHDIIDLNMD